MTVFKACLKIAWKYKFVILMYTLILVFFSAFNVQNNENSMSFTPSKPDVLIVNNDEDEGITASLIDYISKHANIKEIDSKIEDDALFYRDVNYIIYIPEFYRRDYLNGLNPEIKIKTTGDYQGSLANMLLEKYTKLSYFYRDVLSDENEIISNVESVLDKEIEVNLTTKKDTSSFAKATLYYNFANYAILAGCIYVICLILASFKNININKRTIISSTNYKKFNRQLILSNSLFAIMLWLFYVVLSFILIGKVMFTNYGLIYIVNSFVFLLTALAISFLIGNIVSNKEAMNGIVNVVALGSSFLCGAFVPMEWLPDSVLKLAHILPSYYYIKNNELIKEMGKITLSEMNPIIINILVMIIFVVIFIILANIISKHKRKFA